MTEAELHKEMARVLKEAVLAHERHQDLSTIKETLETASSVVSKSVSAIATTLVTRLLIAIGGAVIWFTVFLFNMRDDTIELKRTNVQINSQLQEIASDLRDTTRTTQQNASAIREIIIKMGLDSSSASPNDTSHKVR